MYMYDVLISYGDFNRNVCTCMTYQFRMGILDARPTTPNINFCQGKPHFKKLAWEKMLSSCVKMHSGKMAQSVLSS